MKHGITTVAEAARALRLSPWQGYAAAVIIFLAASAVAHLAQPAQREALFICYLTAMVLGTLAAGGYAGLAIAAGGGLVIWYRLYPVAEPGDAIALTLYIDAAVLLLWSLDVLRIKLETARAERDRARLLFREGQHRTANNLMFIAAFLRAERREAQRDPTRAAQRLDEAVQRLDTFSRIHRQLSASSGGAQALGAVLGELCEGLIEASGTQGVTVTMDIEPVELSFEQTMIVSLLLTEIVTNALKHAFTAGRDGRIEVRFSRRGGDHVLEVRDNGDGMQRDGSAKSVQGKGHRILEALAAQLDGRLAMSNEGGLRTELTFPRQHPDKALATFFSMPQLSP